ncbi:MAG: tetratricopeptide repeat protein, partial [Holophagales bacterium]|nr:tetratricopeptide repeat protein [Holophagales bacterium]
ALGVRAEAAGLGLAALFLPRQLALRLAEVGRVRDAVRLMERHASSRDPDTLNVFGLVLAESGQSERAREVLLQSIEIDERNPQTRQNLALAALHGADWPLCEQEARAALALNPGLPLAWNYLGISLFNQDRAGEAIEAWQRSVELDAGDLGVLYNLGSVAARFGHADIARPALERFVREASAPGVRDRFATDLATARALLRNL